MAPLRVSPNFCHTAVAKRWRSGAPLSLCGELKLGDDVIVLIPRRGRKRFLDAESYATYRWQLLLTDLMIL